MATATATAMTTTTTTVTPVMPSSVSLTTSTFSTLPPEVRNLIYTYAFQLPQPIRLRSPAERRLRPSRPPRDDARGLLDSCRLVRHEAVSLYYSLNPLIFRSTEHVLAFMSDSHIHPLIRSSLSHIAVDFGDSADADAILKDHIRLVDSCIGTLPRLKALETRFYARTLDACSSSHFHTLALAFDGLDADMNAPPPSPHWPRSSRGSPRSSVCSTTSNSSRSTSGSASPTSTCCSSPCPELPSTPEPLPQPDRDMSDIQAEVMEQYCFNPSAAMAFATSKLKFSVAATSHDYPGFKHDKLICYNLRIGVDGVTHALGPAEDAVQQRLGRVGVLPRRLSDIYDTAADGGFHQRVRATMASCSRIDVGVS